MNITKAIVLEMRDQTGLAMMECKHFLTLANSESILTEKELIEKAIEMYFSKRRTPKAVNFKRRY